MNLPKRPFPAPQDRGNALRGGSYALAVTAVVLAILIAVNVFASALPPPSPGRTSAPPSSIPSPATPRRW